MSEKIYEEMDMWKLSADKRNSMTYWWPLIKDLKVPKPKTILVPIDQRVFYEALFKDMVPPKDAFSPLYEAASEFDYPVFMRTSHSSQKHGWKETCFVKDRDSLLGNFWKLLEDDFLTIDQIADAIVFRQFIPMESYFTAWWGELPVNKEVRCNIENGELRCFHPYWPKSAIKQGMKFNKKEKHWEKKWNTLSHLTKEDVEALNKQWPIVAKAFKDEGWWTCDFAKGKDGVWYLIDMALGPVSFHYPGCDKAPKVKMKDGTIKDMAGQ